VVIGASHFELFWLKEVKGALRRFEGRLTFIWTNQLSFEEMLEASTRLPSQSAILYGTLAVDAKGVRQTGEKTLAGFHARANAPIFGLHSTQLGGGIVGGPLLSFEDLSRDTATVAARMLRGKSPHHLPMATQAASTPVFDWRELHRWSIDEARLPPRSIVLFREPTPWQRYRLQIIAGASFASVMAVCVIALVARLVKRQRAERSLSESEERFRLLSNAAPAMIWTTGPDTRFTSVNRAFLDFTGLPADSEPGDSWIKAVHPDDLRQYREVFTQALNCRTPFRMEYRLRRHDGEYRWILDTGVPRFADGFVWYIGSAIDVTELKLSSTVLSGLSRRLMQSYETERAAITRELNEGLGQRLIGLTLELHGLRKASRDDSHEMHGRVEELCAQFGDLARDIQAMSDQWYSKLDLLGLAASIRSFCQYLSTQHDIDVDFRHDNVPRNLANEVALALFRVLQEALRNAVRHAAVRRVSVALAGRHDEVELVVSDEGVGFDPEAAMRTSGFGLISMQERLRLVGGQCLIESQPGAGTRICARVPLRRND
jgi:PAS domain S-box-containing protein